MPHRNPITALRPLTLAIAIAISSAVATLAPAIASASPRPIPVAMLAPPLEGAINVNTATQEQLELLPGVGPTTATRILEFVKKKPLTHASQLMRVKGIGRKTYERMRPYLVVAGETTLRVADPSAQPKAPSPESPAPTTPTP